MSFRALVFALAFVISPLAEKEHPFDKILMQLDSDSSSWALFDIAEKTKIVIFHSWMAGGFEKFTQKKAIELIKTRRCVDSLWLPMTKAYLNDLRVFNVVNHCYFANVSQEIP